MARAIVAILLLATLCLAFTSSLFAHGQETAKDAPKPDSTQDQAQAETNQQEHEEERQEQQSQQQPDDEEDEAKPVDDEDEDLLLTPHPEVSVSWVFPDNADRRLKLGEVSSLLLGFQNRAEQAFNITGVGAHLQSPFDLSYYIQNFTARRVSGAAVGPGQYGSVEYQFRPDSILEPNEYWMTAWVIYNNSADQVYMHTFYNGTVELYDEGGNFGKSFLNIALAVAVIGVITFILVSVTNLTKRTGVRKLVERGTRTPVDESIEIYKPAAKNRVVTRKTNTKKVKKADKDRE
jgi:hypothetical protein